MPLLKITESKKVTATVTIEEATARLLDQYAAMTKATADDVVQQALDYIFARDKDFEKFRQEQPDARPKTALRLKRPTSAATTPAASTNGTRTHTAATR